MTSCVFVSKPALHPSAGCCQRVLTLCLPHKRPAFLRTVHQCSSADAGPTETSNGNGAHLPGSAPAQEPHALASGLAEALDSTHLNGGADSSISGANQADWSSVPRYHTLQCARVTLTFMMDALF